VGENGTQAKVMGSTPILFVSVGPGAEKALDALSQLAKAMAAPSQGPFGLLSFDPLGQSVIASHWTWLSDFEVPVSPEACGLSRDIAGSDEQLLAAVSSLVRQLRSQEPVADLASPGRVRMSSYIIIDLSVDEAVACALRLMQIVRRADPGHDMAVLGLTARTATSGAEPDDAWFGRWKQLLARLQNESLAKVYLLDGRNTSGTWLDRSEQLHRLAAEFLLHHGIVCRGPLRQMERRRVSPKENILNICGSFGSRWIAADLPEVARRVAQRLAQEDLGALCRQPLSGERREHIEEGAQALLDKMERLYETRRQAGSSSSDETAAQPREGLLRNEEVAAAIGKTVSHVCAHDPLVSLCYLLKCLHPKLRRLLARHRFAEREETRRLVGETLHRQEEETYEPMRMWLAKPDTQWADRFTPADGPPSYVAVSRPSSKAARRAGLILFVVGLASITGGLLFQDRVFALGGGLLALAASVLMILPTGWTNHIRNKVPEGREAGALVPSVSYRRRVPLWGRCVAFGLAVTGLVALAWSLWPGVWSSTMMLPAGLAALIAIVGLGVLLSGPALIRPDQVKQREAPGHLCPPIWNWRAAGLLSLASAWIVLCLGASAPVRVDTVAQWGCHLGALVCLIAAAVLGLRPRVGSVRLVERIPRTPEPLSGGIAGPTAGNDSIQDIEALAQWIGRLTLEPDQCLLRREASEAPRDHEVLFDLMAANWDRQLADAFRSALKLRSNESLRDLALEPKAWAACITRQLQDPTAHGSDLAVLFSLEVVKAWMDSLTLKDLVAWLDLDLARFGRVAARIASPNWPATRVAPDVSVGVIVVDKSLWDALTPLAQAANAPAIVRLDWSKEGDGVSVLRLVQGLTQGWRGFPAMPGQQCESNGTAPAGSTNPGEPEGHQGAARARTGS